MRASDRRSRARSQLRFSSLEYTSEEAAAIDSLLNEKGITTKTVLGEEALESVFKKVTSTDILHIATHGFFLPEQKITKNPEDFLRRFAENDRKPTLENPLLRCGLAFSGANSASSVKKGEDGLATAIEIASMKLPGTDLVTLSACVTGLGEVKSGEGVYSLHRAFLLAGAKTVLASLWQVPDLQTNDLMVEFYRKYLLGKNISKSDALREAQLKVIEQLRKQYGAANPAYWGAFVSIGEL